MGIVIAGGGRDSAGTHSSAGQRKQRPESSPGGALLPGSHRPQRGSQPMRPLDMFELALSDF